VEIEFGSGPGKHDHFRIERDVSRVERHARAVSNVEGYKLLS
jgi:hypothetical protein